MKADESGGTSPRSPLSFEEFYRLHYNAVLRYAERRIDFESAPEVSAETFVIACRKYDRESPFGVSWLYKTAHHLIGTKYRKRARDVKLLERLMESELLRDSQWNVLESDFDEVFASLSHNEQEVLRLTYWEGLTAVEVAEVLGSSEQAVWKRISRAKQAFRTATVIADSDYETGTEGSHA
jgi:RNA polymerase sigma factor (sigma-70 family)